MSLRIKLLRRQMGWSLQALADATGLTKSYLSKIERGICIPSIAAALKIAAALRIDVAQLFGDAGPQDMVAIVRSKERFRISGDGAARGSELEAIAAQIECKRMLPFIVTPDREFSNGPHLSGHGGEEFLFVLKGRVEIAFPHKTEVLRAGDAAYFNAEIPHRLRSTGTVPASVLVVTSSE